jgi:hypothetical protein
MALLVGIPQQLLDGLQLLLLLLAEMQRQLLAALLLLVVVVWLACRPLLRIWLFMVLERWQMAAAAASCRGCLL